MSKYLVAKKFFENKHDSSLLYDAEIEYLESTGVQWIDFVVSRGSNTGAYIDYTLLEDTASRGIFGSGAVNSSNLYDLKFIIVSGNMQRFDRYDRSTMSFLSNVSIRQNFTFNPKGSLDSSPYRYFSSLQGIIGQYDSWYTSEYSLTNTTYSIFRTFNRQDLSPVKMQLHAFELREYTSATNYDIIISFIPVRVGNVGYMYDKVSGQLFGNSGTENFILGPDTKVIEPEIPEENQPSTKFIIGKRFIDITDFVNPNFSSIKKHFETKFQLNFDTDGGNVLESKEVILGKSYGELPIPTKAQNIFIGWFTSASGGIQITSDSIASLDINTLYAHWEYVEILDSESHTEYEVVTTSSYRNTGIYTASISDSSQPIYIDWGDGTVEKTTSSISQRSHTYKTNGNFIIKISDNITSFAPSYSNSTWYGTTSQNRYTFKGMISTGSKVTSLPAYAFYYCQAMTNIDFMETCWPTVMFLTDYCFYYCSGLTSIQGAKRFTSLGSYCFQYCSGLTGIQDLSKFKFTTLPNSYTFANCTNVTQWILPDGFTGTSFGSYMFSNNSKLTNVGNIEKTINQIKAVQIEYLESTGTQYIDTGIVFYNVQTIIRFALTRLQQQDGYVCASWNANNNRYPVVMQSADRKIIIHDKNLNRLFTCPEDTLVHSVVYNDNGEVFFDDTYVGSISPLNQADTTYSIALFCYHTNSGFVQGSASKIFACTFINNNDGKAICDFIPVRVGNVGYMYDKISGKLFENKGTGNFILGPDKTDAEEIIIEQEAITSKLPESLTSTGTYTFQNCSNLNNIIIPSKVQSIGNYAFYGCTLLNNVSIEATNLTAINQYAFYNCNKLVDLDLPDTVKTIGNYAFYGCTNLDYAGRMTNDLPYDAEIEYLESTGTQYIDTEIQPAQNLSFEVKFNVNGLNSGYGNVFGSRQNTRTLEYQTTCYDGGSIGVGTRNSNLKFYPGIINTITYDGINMVNINGVTSVITTSTCQPTTGSIILFGIRQNGQITQLAGGKIYYVKFGAVRDFIPVRVGNVGYMYDKVSGQLFGNSGTGNFILGPDVKTKELPSQLTSIGANAYQGCSNLKSLNISENLQTIGDYAFAGCYQISSIVDKRLTAQTVSTNTFGSATGTSNTAFTGYQTKGNNILSTYFAATGYDENAWDDPLQNPAKCGFIQQYIDPENVVYHTVTFNAGLGEVSESTRSIVKGKKIGELPTPRCPVDTPYFGGWFTSTNGTGTKISKDYKITSDITFYALYSTVPFTVCNIDLNNQWRASSKANPDSSLYDGPYESNSNYNIGNAYSKMYIRISGYSTFNVYIRSYAESSYDYVVAMNLDVDVTSNPSSGTSNVKAHTSGKQNSGTAIGNYTKVEYTNIPDGEHFICIVYRKDGSVNNGDDRGYVLIDKQDGASTDSRSIFLVDDVGILYDEDKQLMIASERI